MTIIVCGRIYLKRGTREEFVRKSTDAVVAARGTDGCFDFAVSPDPVDEDRVNVFEHWRSREDLDAFRQAGPGDDLVALIESADVTEHVLP